MDAELVERAQSGDRAAFEVLARRIVDRFHAVAYSILSDAQLAQDATQRALLNVWCDLPKLRDPERFGGWSYRLLVRACFAEARRAPRWLPETLLERTPDVGATVDLDTVVDRDQLERGFRRLTIEQRTVIVLHHFADLPLDQVADVLGVAEGPAYELDGLRDGQPVIVRDLAAKRTSRGGKHLRVLRAKLDSGESPHRPGRAAGAVEGAGGDEDATVVLDALLGVVGACGQG